MKRPDWEQGVRYSVIVHGEEGWIRKRIKIIYFFWVEGFGWAWWGFRLEVVF